MNPAHYSSLLPEIFRHNTSRARVCQPKVILIDFHGTISERRWEDKVIYPYVKKSVPSYMRDNMCNETVQKCLPGLINESFEQRFRHKYDDAPVIDDVENSDSTQFSEFLLWQMNNKRETKDTQSIERLVWQDGFKRHQIFTPIYDDVMPSIKKWREQCDCLIYIISSTDTDTLKLLFENTDKGNLNQYINGYLGSKKSGEKMISETYNQFYEHLPNSLKPPKSPKKAKSAQSVSISSQSSDLNGRTVLFLTDSGQEAKAASQVADGTAFECMLVNRPGNKRIRTYYLSQFQYVEKFDDIEFV